MAVILILLQEIAHCHLEHDERLDLTVDDKEARWDRASVHEFRGTYGEYLLKKVSKVFPELGDGVL